MVRVISEKLFSPPRSRHSSGEAVDKELAARAVEALSGFNSRRLELSDYESSSDSHWDSEVDIEGDGLDVGVSEGRANGEKSPGGTDVIQKRKERRRERNKLSAQAYRIRRREQSVKQQTVLRELQEKNTRLKTQVHTLETEIDKFRRTAVKARLPTTTTTATSSASTTPFTSASAHPHCDPLQPVRELEQEDLQPMDNDLPHRQLISPVVDNFSFSRPSPTPSPSLMPPSPSSSSLASPASGAGHSFSSNGNPPPPTAFVPAAPSDNPEGYPAPFQHPLPPPPPPRPHPQLPDLNANGEGQHHHTTNNANSRVSGPCLNDNTNNNNGNVFLAVPCMGGARPKAKAVLMAPQVFKFSQAGTQL